MHGFKRKEEKKEGGEERAGVYCFAWEFNFLIKSPDPLCNVASGYVSIPINVYVQAMRSNRLRKQGAGGYGKMNKIVNTIRGK